MLKSNGAVFTMEISIMPTDRADAVAQLRAEYRAKLQLPRSRELSLWIDEAIAADLLAARARIAECAPYLKDGETPAECIQRNRADVDTMLGQLAKAKTRIEELEQLHRRNALMAEYFDRQLWQFVSIDSYIAAMH